MTSSLRFRFGIQSAGLRLLLLAVGLWLGHGPVPAAAAEDSEAAALGPGSHPLCGEASALSRASLTAWYSDPARPFEATELKTVLHPACPVLGQISGARVAAHRRDPELARVMFAAMLRSELGE
ncbi:MAG: hypothetical protein VX498_10430, partial [Myxococcota bacterium]|nr:hypothetical protein [Myxococcota bacterium]